MPSDEGAPSVDAVRLAEGDHAQHLAERDPPSEGDRLERSDVTHVDVRVEERRVLAADDDVTVGHEVEPGRGAQAVDRDDHRLEHAGLPRRVARVLLLDGQLADLAPRRERSVAGSRDDDRSYVGIPVELRATAWSAAFAGRTSRR